MSASWERGTSLCDPFLDLFPIAGAAVSLLGKRVGQSTLCASNDSAARLDELQFDAGDGPCWQAMESRQIVAAADLLVEEHTEWPGFMEAFRDDPIAGEIASMYAFPLVAGSLEIGAIDLYSGRPNAMSVPDVRDAAALAKIASWQVLRRILADDDPEADARPRREVNQAIGMVLAQLNISAQDANLLLRAHAYSMGKPVLEIATDVIERRLDFSGQE
jgi:hypothetical protein